MKRAAVFDCDGVLVDSEPHSRRAWVEVLGHYSHPAQEDDVAAYTGFGFLPTHAAMSAIAALPPPIEVWPRLMEALTASFRSGLEVFSDAVAVLGAVEEAGLLPAVASASPRERLDVTLAAAGLADRFPVSVAGDEVKASKPDPAVYLEAAARLGVPPADSVAIEDSVAGVLAATRAGMDVVAVVRDEATRPSLQEAGAMTVDGLLPEHLGL